MLTDNYINSNSDSWIDTYTYDKYSNCLTKKDIYNGEINTYTYSWKLYYNPKYADEDYMAAFADFFYF